MPAGSELVESTEPSGTPGTFPMRVRVMAGLTNACSPFGGPMVELKRAMENIWDGKLYAKCERTSPGRRAVSTLELRQWEPCQDEGGTEKERKVPGRKKLPKSSGKNKLSYLKGQQGEAKMGSGEWLAPHPPQKLNLRKSWDSQKHTRTYFQRDHCPQVSRGFILNS